MRYLHNILSLVIITSALSASEKEWVDITTEKITNRTNKDRRVVFFETKQESFAPSIVQNFCRIFHIPLEVHEYQSSMGGTQVVPASQAIKIPAGTTLIHINHEQIIKLPGLAPFHHFDDYEIETESSYSIMELYNPNKPKAKKPHLFIHDESGEVVYDRSQSYYRNLDNKKSERLIDHELIKLDPEYWTDHAKAKRDTTVCCLNKKMEK